MLPEPPDDEAPWEAEPEPWRPPVRCPACNSDETRFMTLQYERSVYLCEACETQFELEEPAE